MKLTTLPNGLRIAVETMPSHVRSVSIGVWIGVGSRWETEPLRGASHLLEHMVFKGSERFSAQRLAEAMDECGGRFNAFTGKEYTCYWADVLREDWPRALELLLEMVCSPRLAEADLRAEKNVVLEEINMYEDLAEEVVLELGARCVWPQHPLGEPIVGSAASVAGIDAAALRRFHARYYNPRNMIVTACGAVDHDAFCEAAMRLVETHGFAPNAVGAIERDPFPIPERTLPYLAKAKDGEQAHLCLVRRGFDAQDEALAALQLLVTVLGGGVSSRLFQSVRERHGLVYDVYAFHETYADTGMLGIYAACSSGRVETLLSVIAATCTALRRDGVTRAELRRAQAQAKLDLALSQDNSNARMHALGHDLLQRGKVRSWQDRFAAIDRVEVAHLQALAEEMLALERWSLCIVSERPPARRLVV